MLDVLNLLARGMTAHPFEAGLTLAIVVSLAFAPVLFLVHWLATPAPRLTEAGRIALARAVLEIKPAHGEAPAAPSSFRKLVPARPASQSNAFTCDAAQ
jgi:hypothetical protein